MKMKWYSEEQAFYGQSEKGIVRVESETFLRVKAVAVRKDMLDNPDFWAAFVGASTGVTAVDQFPNNGIFI